MYSFFCTHHFGLILSSNGEDLASKVSSHAPREAGQLKFRLCPNCTSLRYMVSFCPFDSRFLRNTSLYNSLSFAVSKPTTFTKPCSKPCSKGVFSTPCVPIITTTFGTSANHGKSYFHTKHNDQSSQPHNHEPQGAKSYECRICAIFDSMHEARYSIMETSERYSDVSDSIAQSVCIS